MTRTEEVPTQIPLRKYREDRLKNSRASDIPPERSPGYFAFWGKARNQGEAGPLYHLLVYHCLDVAAVADVLLREQRHFVGGVAEFLNIKTDSLNSWLTYLMAIHDIGKFADGFQSLRPDLLLQLQGRQVSANFNERHDTLGYRYTVGTENRPGAVVSLFAEEQLPESDPADVRDLLSPWLNAVEGHHGRPPHLQISLPPISLQFPPPTTENMSAYLRDVSSLFLPEGLPLDLSGNDFSQAFRRISWLIAGLAVAADWIGSNEAWFPYHTEPMPLIDYWRDIALPQATSAVAESGLPAAASAPWSGLQELFPKIEALSPLQRLMEEIELSSYPQLVIVEEVTGGGKTEAAIALAHRLMERGAADGIYLALPTMATANAMHHRVRDVYRRLFIEGSEPSLVLAHSASRMTLDLEEKNRDDRGPFQEEESASRQCSEWLADNRKKALLAHVGVGTIDQALLAVLAARYQSMRLFGLCRKVLIVDEVHACDTYVHRLLCTLLKFHAALGGNAILLSATLPAWMREELVLAFNDGLGATPATIEKRDYPLVMRLSDQTDQPFRSKVTSRFGAWLPAISV